jgi:Acyl-CoA synthetase (NDP forming)
MAPGGYDLFIGGLQDPVFGPVVVFGAGGIQVEVFADVARLLCPTGEAEVLAELGRLHCARLFQGFRGRPAMDPAPFARAVVGSGNCSPISPDRRIGPQPGAADRRARCLPWTRGCGSPPRQPTGTEPAGGPLFCAGGR